MTVKEMVSQLQGQVLFKRPKGGENFNRSHMVTWTSWNYASSLKVIALTFAVLTGEDGNEEEFGNIIAYWPSTVALQTPQRIAIATLSNQAEEVNRLEHILTTDRTVCTSIQTFALLKGRG